MTPAQLPLPVATQSVWDWGRLVLQCTLTPEQMAAVNAEARKAQCSRVVAWERVREEVRG